MGTRIEGLLADLLQTNVQTNAGKFVACNIVDAVEQDVLDWNKAKEALLFCSDLHYEMIKPLADDTLRYKKTCALFHKLFTANPSLRFQANQPGEDATHDECVCWVTSFRALAEHYVNFARVSAHFVFSNDSDFSIDKMKAAISALSSSETRPSAIMRGLVETWWHTQPESFHKNVSTSRLEERAERTRDWLGLIHHEKGTALVAINIPADTVASAYRVKRPTFVEAGNHPRFRTWLDSTPSDWGRAVDLLALELGATENVEGGQERVASPVPFAALDRVSAQFLGIVSTTHEEEMSTDRFLALIMRERDIDELHMTLAQLANRKV